MLMLRLRLRGFAVLLAAAAACPVRADLGPARAEQNLEKRARLALENAGRQVKAAHKAFDAGNWEEVLAALEQTRESVDLAMESLKQTGKNPRRGGKSFKNAEIRMRELLRAIDGLRLKTSGEEQAAVEKLRLHVQRVHDELLNAILGRIQWRPPR